MTQAFSSGGLARETPFSYDMSNLDIGQAMATNVHLTAELETFARECVSSGRYNNVSEVLRSALRLLQDTEEQRRNFHAMLDAARREADRDGVYELDAVLAEMDAVIDKTSR